MKFRIDILDGWSGKAGLHSREYREFDDEQKATAFAQAKAQMNERNAFTVNRVHEKEA